MQRRRTGDGKRQIQFGASLLNLCREIVVIQDELVDSKRPVLLYELHRHALLGDDADRNSNRYQAFHTLGIFLIGFRVAFSERDIEAGVIAVFLPSRSVDVFNRILELRPGWSEKVKVVMTESNKDREEWRAAIGNKRGRDELAKEFKDNDSKMKIAIVVDMWLTGTNARRELIDEAVTGLNFNL